MEDIDRETGGQTEDIVRQTEYKKTEVIQRQTL